MHRQGKNIRRPDMGIRMLRDDQGEWQVGASVEQEMNKYVRKMWGTKTKGAKDILSEEEWGKIQGNQEDIDKILNSTLELSELNRACGKLKDNKTPGEDLTPNEVFKNMDMQQREKLLDLLEKCRMSSKFPKGWKETELKWIYKKADPSKIANYRPIALTDTLYKIFTRIMTERLERVAEKYGIITDLQNGFRVRQIMHGSNNDTEHSHGKKTKGKSEQ